MTLLDPAVLSRIESLELLARVVVEGFINGLHRSPHLGFSVDFAEHRAYLPGDDVRRIDWRLYARSDRLYLKEFEADTNTNVAVLLDVSPSMRFGSLTSASGGLTKLDYARRLAACLLWFSQRQRDRVGLVTFDREVVDYVPCAAKHLRPALLTLERIGGGGGDPRRKDAARVGRVAPSARGGAKIQPGGGPAVGGLAPRDGDGAYDHPFAQIADEFRRRSILVVISDLYDEPERVAAAVGRLRGRGNDLIVLHVLDPAERTFPYDDAASFRDLESGEWLPVVPERMRERYRALVEAHVAELGTRLRERGADYALLDTATPLDRALFDYLAYRERVRRVR